MKTDQATNPSVQHSAHPIPLHVRARPHVKGIGKALKHCDEQRPVNRVTVEELLQWAYAREKVHLARPPGLDAGVRLRPRGFAAQSSSERIGAAVGSSMNMGFEAPRDAYAVHAAVSDLAPAHMAALVRTYAMIGHAPDWTPQPVIWWEQGAPIYGKDRKGRGDRRIVGYCVYARGDLPALVEERRAVYSRWALAVAGIQKALLDGALLSDHVLDGALPQRAPWSI